MCGRHLSSDSLKIQIGVRRELKMEELVIGVEEAVQIQEEQILQVQVEQKSKESSVQNEEVATVKDISEEVLKESRRIVDTLVSAKASKMTTIQNNI